MRGLVLIHLGVFNAGDFPIAPVDFQRLHSFEVAEAEVNDGGVLRPQGIAGGDGMDQGLVARFDFNHRAERRDAGATPQTNADPAAGGFPVILDEVQQFAGAAGFG